MAVPQTESGAHVTAVAAASHATGTAPSSEHPAVTLAWLVAGLAIAAGIEPWLSQYAGVMLPAFALVRTARRPVGASD